MRFTGTVSYQWDTGKTCLRCNEANTFNRLYGKHTEHERTTAQHYEWIYAVCEYSMQVINIQI